MRFGTTQSGDFARFPTNPEPNPLRVSLSSLSSRLKPGLVPLYHLFGSEILLLEEALDEIRRQARAQGFTERIRYSLEPGFDWNRVIADSRSMSLFAGKKIIELRMPTGKPGDAGAKALNEYVDSISGNDTVLVLISGAIDKRAQNSKWFKKVESAGVVVECPGIPTGKLPEWISRRMRDKGLQFDSDAAERLGHFVEGNLLAAAQEINLLALLSPDRKITIETVENAIADHAQFTIYTLVDACLAGSAHRCTRILQSLRRNQAEPVLILWALTRETRTLCHLSAGLAKGANPGDLFRRHGVWSSRGSLVNSALRRLSVPHCHNLLRRLARADLMLKGRAPMQRRDIWEEIESIGLRLCGLRIH